MCSQNREANVSALKQLSPAGCCYVRMGFLKKKMVHQKSRSTLTSIYVVYWNLLNLHCLHCLLSFYWWVFFEISLPICWWCPNVLCRDQEIYVFSPCAPVCLFGMHLIDTSWWICFEYIWDYLYHVTSRQDENALDMSQTLLEKHQSRYVMMTLLVTWVTQYFCGLHRFHLLAQFGCVLQACVGIVRFSRAKVWLNAGYAKTVSIMLATLTWSMWHSGSKQQVSQDL